MKTQRSEVSAELGRITKDTKAAKTSLSEVSAELGRITKDTKAAKTSRSEVSAELGRNTKVSKAAKAILILSGGLDSSTLGYWLKNNGYSDLVCVTFDYGQKQIIEFKSAAAIAKKLDAAHHLIDITFIKKFLALSGSSLTNPEITIPHGEYTRDNMQSTVVPNRNSMLLTIAWTIACIEKADVLAYGAHGGDHYVYPDTRPDYFNAINLSLRLGTEDTRRDNLNLIAPFINWDKADIVRQGTKLGVPFELTWTCYEGGEIHCGLCGACSQRKKGFIDAGINDPTIYQS